MIIYEHILNQRLNDLPIKKLKNDASERLVPVHRQLLDLGFVDYINRQKTRLKAKDTDFIIKKCQTSGGEYNNKFFTRELSPFFMDIKVNPDAYIHTEAMQILADGSRSCFDIACACGAEYEFVKTFFDMIKSNNLIDIKYVE